MPSTDRGRVLPEFFLLPQQPALRSAREGEGGTGTYFLHNRKKKHTKNQNSLSFSGGGVVGFKAVGLKFTAPYPHTHAHTRTYLGSAADLGPSQVESYFSRVLGLHFSASRPGPNMAPHTKPVASTVLPFLPSQAGVVSQGLPFR